MSLQEERLSAELEIPDVPVKFDGDINKGVPNHECELPHFEHAIIRYIHSGIFVDLRRKLKKLTMVSHVDQNSKALYKSTAQIRKEENIHLAKYYNMIHPFSKARFWWEMTMILVYFSQLIMIPLEISTIHTVEDFVVYSNFVLDLLSMVDMALFFRTGYHDKMRQKVIMEPKKVAIRYLETYFFFDLMSSLPISFVLHVHEGEWSHLWPLKLLMIFKLTRLAKMITYLEKLCERNHVYSYNMKVINFGIYFVMLMIWATSIENLVKEADGEHHIASMPYSERMLHSCFLITMRFMLVGLIRSAKNNVERSIQALCLFFGSILNMVILAQIIQIYKRRSGARNKYTNLMQQLTEYMKYKELPYRLKEKVFKYVEFKFQKHIFKEADVFNNLSTRLKEEVTLHNCQKLVDKVDFFKDAPLALIMRIVSKMKSEIYLPSDTIVQAGVTGNAMYFIHMGTVAVYAKNGKEICHLHDGNHFGEIALVINEARVATVIAIADCELFRLSRRDYQDAISPFPEFANKIRRSALGRLESTKKLTQLADPKPTVKG